MKDTKTQMKIYIEDSKKEKLEVFAQTLGRPVNTVMNEIIDAYLKEQMEKVVIDLWSRGHLILKGGIDA